MNERAEIRSVLQNLRLSNIPLNSIKIWENQPDRKVVGETLTTTCYLPESFTASLYFAWKYSDNFLLAVLANAKVGGDNCHRGVVVGSIVGMQTGIPKNWLNTKFQLPSIFYTIFQIGHLQYAERLNK